MVVHGTVGELGLQEFQALVHWDSITREGAHHYIVCRWESAGCIPDVYELTPNERIHKPELHHQTHTYTSIAY